MTLKDFRKSRALWRRRELFRAARLKLAVTASKRTHWTNLLAEATRIRKRRDKQIAGLTDASIISAKGLDFLTRQEGIVRYAYNDSQGHATFGVGHLLHRGPVTPADRRKWGTKARPKPMKFVIDVLDDDLDRYEQAVRDHVKVPLKQHEFDALVSFSFNIGTEGFRKSTAVEVLNDRSLPRATKLRRVGDAMRMWNKPPEILGRRRREIALFQHGAYHT